MCGCGAVIVCCEQDGRMFIALHGMLFVDMGIILFFIFLLCRWLCVCFMSIDGNLRFALLFTYRAAGEGVRLYDCSRKNGEVLGHDRTGDRKINVEKASVYPAVVSAAT